MNRATILIMGGYPNYHPLLQMELEQEGYEVVAAEDVTEVVEVVREKSPALVILDLSLGGMDGIRAMEQMLRINRKLSVIIYSSQPFWRNVMTWPAEAYIVKSSDVDDLKREIRSVLEQRAREMNER